MINCHIMPSCMNTIEKILCDTGDEPSENLKKKNGIFDCIYNGAFEQYDVKRSWMWWLKQSGILVSFIPTNHQKNAVIDLFLSFIERTSTPIVNSKRF